MIGEFGYVDTAACKEWTRAIEKARKEYYEHPFSMFKDNLLYWAAVRKEQKLHASK